MKALKTTLLLITLCFAFNGNAQIWKKLSKKAEKAAERAIERKVEEKAERETEKAFDSTFNNSSNKKKKKNKKSSPFSMKQSTAQPDSNYNFTHKYVMQIEHEKGNMALTYFLTNTGNYIGSKMDIGKKNNQNMLMIMDANKNAVFMLMDMKDRKTLMASDFDFSDVVDESTDNQNVNVSKTGKTKQILGYNCEEFIVFGDDFKGTIWVTQEAGVQFLNLTSGMKKNKNFNSQWFNYAKGLVMEMNMEDTSKRKPKKVVMRCIALDKEDFSIDTTAYKSMF
ncbi:DUF4412 domain-containing protein [Lacinutrix salivirga]